MGHNNPMAIENFSDKMEFQGRGAGHIHGAAWCDLNKISEELDIECSLTDSEDDDDSDNETEQEENKPINYESDLEKAFRKLRRDEKLKKIERKALVAFADKFTTCTLNPDMAAKMIDETTSLSEGIKIVEIVEETQKHHHTKTCKKHGPECRFGMPRFPSWKTVLTKSLKGKTDEEKQERRKTNKDILDRVKVAFENDEVVDVIMKEFGDKKKESKEEYIQNRKRRILKLLELVNVNAKRYLDAVREQSKKGVSVILARDIDELYINNYNPEWLRAWNANIDIQICFDFFAIITYITEYFTKDESGTTSFLNLAAKQCSEMGLTEQKRCIKSVFLTHRQMGISEAYMKILQEMRFKDSTIGTEFLPLGKREDISRFVVRADDKIASNMEVFEIPGREGLYFEKPNWIDRNLSITFSKDV